MPVCVAAVSTGSPQPGQASVPTLDNGEQCNLKSVKKHSISVLYMRVQVRVISRGRQVQCLPVDRHSPLQQSRTDGAVYDIWRLRLVNRVPCSVRIKSRLPRRCYHCRIHL